jgi:predicted protein tyrosine phosphatase
MKIKRLYIVRSIGDLIQLHKAHPEKENMAIITITDIDYNYDFPSSQHYKFSFKDCFKGEKEFITKREAMRIGDIIPELSSKQLICVACDAGISRSPAVAMAIADQLGDEEEKQNIKYTHPHFNLSIYEFIKETLR